MVGVRFSRSGRIVYFDCGELHPAPGDHVEVETCGGPRLGVVVIGCGQVIRSDLRGPLRSVIRIVASPT